MKKQGKKQKQQKTAGSSGRFLAWLKREKWGLLVLAVAAVLFAAACLRLRPEAEQALPRADYVEYEKGVVDEVLPVGKLVQDPASDGAWRGEQWLNVKVETGQYAGKVYLVKNYPVNPLYSVPLREGDSVILQVDTYSAGGEVRVNIYEYNRIPILIAVVAAFFLVTLLVGRKTGLKSLVALALTVACLFLVLLPALMRGAPTLPTVFAVCVFIAVVSFTILGGLHRKSVCAMLGTVAGTALALGFGLLAQHFARIDGLRFDHMEPLLQLRQSGTPLGLRGLLVGGLVISALGAVMDVAMSISSALEEVHDANPELGLKALFRSGMNIGRDMVGTMTNTLILAFLGSGFSLILYLYSLSPDKYVLFSSPYMSIEVISGIASSAGMILAIPLTAFISAALISRKRTQAAETA